MKNYYKSKNKIITFYSFQKTYIQEDVRAAIFEGSCTNNFYKILGKIKI